MTKFLIADQENPNKDMCRDGEIVVPAFPSNECNMFLGLESFRLCRMARVALIEDDIFSALPVRMEKEFPGLPSTMHRQYVLQTAIACSDRVLGEKVNIMSTYDTYELVFGGNHVVKLWDKQPLK